MREHRSGRGPAVVRLRYKRATAGVAQALTRGITTQREESMAGEESGAWRRRRSGGREGGKLSAMAVGMR